MAKTHATDADVTAFLDAIPDERRRAEGHALRGLLERVTGEQAAMWGATMVGFGSARSGTGEWFVVGFAPRKAALTLYGVYDDDAVDPQFEELGPHTVGKGCLYLKRLDAVDPGVLEALVSRAWAKRAPTA